MVHDVATNLVAAAVVRAVAADEMAALSRVGEGRFNRERGEAQAEDEGIEADDFDDALAAAVERLAEVLEAHAAALAAHLRPRTAGHPGGGPVYAEARPRESFAECAELRAGSETRGYAFLSDAVIAFCALPDERQARATIKVLDSGAVYKAPAIRRLHDKPPQDEEDMIRAALAR